MMPPVKKKGFLRAYKASLLGSLVVFLVAVWPLMAMHLNPPPAEGATQSLRGVILGAQQVHPNLHLQLPDGSVQALDFPQDLMGLYTGKWPRIPALGPDEVRMLKGCDAEVQVDHLRYVLISANPRIWSLKCDRLSFSRDALLAYYQRNAPFSAVDIGVLACCMLLLLAQIAREYIDRAKEQNQANGIRPSLKERI